VFSLLAGGFGKMDRGSRLSASEARPGQYAPTNTIRDDSLIHHHASLPIHFRDQTYGHHTEGENSSV
jgi:hypothetical protein